MESRFINGVRCRHEYRCPDRNVRLCAYKVVLLVGGQRMNILTIIGLILTLVVTLPVLGILILCEAVLIYRDRRERPDAKPLSKDEWKIM